MKWLKKLSATQLVALGFLLIILLGTLLLMLPVASRSSESASPLTCLFTATSATCVTGLVVVDTYTQWTLFGQLVILVLIQIGGLGFMTIFSIAWMMFRHKIGLYGRTVLMRSTGFLTHDSVVRLVKRIFAGTLIFEGAGALIISVRLIPIFGFARGIWYSVFHSVSAFCNAGFDLFGGYEGGAFSSVSAFARDPVVMLTLALLIIVGGIGFVVWGDVSTHGYHVTKYRLHTKIVLVTTGILVLSGTALFFCFEYNTTMAGMNFGERLLSSFFLSVTTRTAGFDHLGVGGLSDSGAFLAIALMFIGGSPGSTAGGIKTSTFAVLILDVFASSTRRGSVTVFRRRIDETTIKRATAIMMVYLVGIIAATILICAVEPQTLGLKDVLFEVVSAVGTVGLSMGITSSLGILSKIVLIFLMYAGRIGGISLVLIMREKRKVGLTERPTENILIG